MQEYIYTAEAVFRSFVDLSQRIPALLQNNHPVLSGLHEKDHERAVKGLCLWRLLTVYRNKFFRVLDLLNHYYSLPTWPEAVC